MEMEQTNSVATQRDEPEPDPVRKVFSIAEVSDTSFTLLPDKQWDSLDFIFVV